MVIPKSHVDVHVPLVVGWPSSRIPIVYKVTFPFTCKTSRQQVNQEQRAFLQEPRKVRREGGGGGGGEGFGIDI